MSCLAFTSLIIHAWGTSCTDVNVLRYNPAGLFETSQFGYSHITIDVRSGMAHLAGQIACRKYGTMKGTTVTEQMMTATENLNACFVSMDATVEDIAKLMVYIVGYKTKEHVGEVIELSKSLGRPALTVLGVESLALPSLLVEIEATVVLSSKFIDSLKWRRCDGSMLLETTTNEEL